ALDQPVDAADVGAGAAAGDRGVDQEEVGHVRAERAAAARPDVAVQRAGAGLVGGDAAAVARAERVGPGDVAGLDEVRGRLREAGVRRVAAQQRPGDLGGRRVGLDRAVVRLRDLQVAAARAGDEGHVATADAQVGDAPEAPQHTAVAQVDAGGDALVVAE